MKKRRKHLNCLNCGHPLDHSFNFCPNCGQENTDNEVGVSLLLKEFASNFFSIDSRFGRTILPFLFQPGKITVSFNEGQRVRYANPIRWYLVISLFHFFFLSFFINKEEKKPNEEDSFTFIGNMATKAEADSIMAIPDSLLYAANDWPIPTPYWSVVNYLQKEGNLTPTEIMDTLQFNDLSWPSRAITHKIIKVGQESQQSISNYLYAQVPLIIFLSLPFYAFILKLFFWRRGLYIKHLIHSIHIHSFLFFVNTLFVIVALATSADLGLMVRISFAITALYIVLSFHRVYNLRKRWAAGRLLLVGLTYSVFFTIIFVVGMLLSFAFF